MAWSDFDKTLKATGLKHEGKPELVTIARAGTQEAYNDKTQTKEDVPAIWFVEYPNKPLLVSSNESRKRLIMLFGDDEQNAVRKQIVIEVQKRQSRDSIVIVGEWTQGDTWREIQQNKSGEPLKVEVKRKPGVSSEPRPKSGESSPKSTSLTAPAAQARGRVEPISTAQEGKLLELYTERYNLDVSDSAAALDQRFQDKFGVNMAEANYDQAKKVLAELFAEARTQH